MANYVKAIEFDSQLHQKQVKYFPLSSAIRNPFVYTGSVARDAKYRTGVSEKPDCTGP